MIRPNEIKSDNTEKCSVLVLIYCVTCFWCISIGVPTSNASDQKMIQLSYDMECTYDLSYPPGTVGIPLEGAWDGSMKFDPPVHPNGTIKDLTYNGQRIDLISTEIQQGFLKTKEFGNIEVLLLGAGPRGGGVVFRATNEQITKMDKMIEFEKNDGVSNKKRKNKTVKTEYPLYNARHILLRTESEAYKIINKLNKGGDFQVLAKQYSIGPTKYSGGFLGWFSADRMLKEFSDAVKKMKVKTYSKKPVQTKLGWHVIKLEDIKYEEN